MIHLFRRYCGESIRTTAIWTLLYYARKFCNDSSAFKGILSVSNAFTKYMAKYHPKESKFRDLNTFLPSMPIDYGYNVFCSSFFSFVLQLHISENENVISATNLQDSTGRELIESVNSVGTKRSRQAYEASNIETQCSQNLKTYNLKEAAKLRYFQCLKYENNDNMLIVFNMFRKKKGVRFLKNFLRGNQCGFCFSVNKKLRICKGCSFEYYCSKQCQKRHWIEHKVNCLK